MFSQSSRDVKTVQLGSVKVVFGPCVGSTKFEKAISSAISSQQSYESVYRKVSPCIPRKCKTEFEVT